MLANGVHLDEMLNGLVILTGFGDPHEARIGTKHGKTTSVGTEHGG